MAGVYEGERESLLQRLLDSVKKCQATFGDKKNSLATENDTCVACVIEHFEQALLHGLKKNKVWEKIPYLSEPLRQVTQKMLPEIMEITYWSLLKDYLCSLDVQHFQTIERITTDAGRARVWLRTALNENTLENHLNSILGHATLRSQFYEGWALMMDDERASTIPTMARGLGSILFAIDTKSADLNKPFTCVFTKNEQESKTHRRIKSNPLPVMAEMTESRDSTPLKSGNLKKKKKRKVNEARITDMDEIPDTTCLLSSSYTEASSHSDGVLSMSKGTGNTLLRSSSADTCTVRNTEKLNVYNYDKQPDTVLPCGDNEIGHQKYDGDKEQLVSILFEESEHIGNKNKSVVDSVDTEETNSNHKNANERVEEVDPDVSSFPTLDMVTDIVDRMLETDDTLNYLPDYDNKCLAEQLQTLNITTNAPSENSALLQDEDVLCEEDIQPCQSSEIYTPILLPHQGEALLEDISLLAQNMSTVSFKAGANSGEIKDGNDSRNEMESSNDSSNSFGEEDILNNIMNEALQNEIDRKSLEDVIITGESTETSNVLDMDDEDIFEVGSENSKFTQILAFDRESSQAVNDTVLVTQISNTDPILPFDDEVEVEPTSPDMEKYIPKFIPQQKQNASDDLSSDDLKKVILANAKMKEDLEESKRLLHIAYNQQQEELCLLRMEHERMQKDFHTRETKYKKKSEELSNENELLRKQLKYVMTVQNYDRQMDDDVPEGKGADGVVASEQSSTTTTELPTHKCVDVDEEESRMFEGKLIQMAEMHSDVLELQGSLHRQIVAKNNQISMMREQLVELRGPLPDNTLDASCESLESLYTPQTKLINIWIPSVFKKMKTPESHHIYQIYLRIGSEEWNIYRRYSQFDKLHTEACKSYPSLEDAIFPKKKYMKLLHDAKLVERRRLQLQDYLRKLINTLIERGSISTCDATKRKLADLYPFFREDSDNDKSSKTNKDRNVDDSAVYNGL